MKFTECACRGTVWTTKCDSRLDGVANLFSHAGLEHHINQPTILIKPNLVEALQPPITTPVEIVEAVILYLKNKLPDKRIIIGEGTGSTDYDTFHCYDLLGYIEMARGNDVELIDLNKEEWIMRERNDCPRWPQMYLPKLLDDVFLLSVPVLKAHSLSSVTLTMKNMMGCPPPAHYQQGGHWGKSSFHANIQDAVFDLNQYRTPDFSLLDASIGMAQAHLWGPQCDPPIGKIAVSWDPVAIDSYGCRLLGKDYTKIGHISKANGILGCAEPLEIITL
ncbi:DUF362 domain-containing protein [Desulfopila sp. IMCC35008]|uniref:DUF362 domain-containing protein n=1 Tax=Desulfopila sp. IMCC35008 TaxID=2653858 RepID=UPI0013D72285|nr:DUF362 domain-containing protein [Desulfopila sp. IMCC35008]